MVATSSPLIAGLTRCVRARERRHVAEQEAGDVEDMDAEVLDDEALALGEIGLAGEHVIAGAEGNAAPERRRRSRRLSSTVRSPPGSAFASGNSHAPSAARRPCGRPRPWPWHPPASARKASGRSPGRCARAASSTSGRWLGTVVAISTKSSCSSPNISAASA